MGKDAIQALLIGFLTAVISVIIDRLLRSYQF